MAVKKKSSNPVGRPKKKYGAETLANTKKTFKMDNNNVVLDKYGDALILMALILGVANLVLFFVAR